MHVQQRGLHRGKEGQLLVLKCSKNEVTVDKPFKIAKYLNKAADKLLETHKDCLTSKEELENECTADGRPLQTKVCARGSVRRCVLPSSNALC